MTNERPPRKGELKGALIASGLQASADIAGDDGLDTKLLHEMSRDAEHYLSSFTWCTRVLASFFAGGVGGIFAIFLIHIEPARPEVDSWIWVAIGDIPPAYLPVTDCGTAAEVFRAYINGMSRWVELARKGITGTPEDGIPPVNVPATPEWAEKLNQRLSGLIWAVKPFFENETEDPAN